MLTFTGDTSAAGRLGAFRFLEAAQAWAAYVEPLVRAQLMGHAPVGKGEGAGRLRDSTRSRHHATPAGFRIEFTSDVPHAKYVLHGTKPHVIRPRTAKALYWVDPKGGDRFARLVHHPGTKPNRFPQRAVEPVVPLIRRELVRQLDHYLHRG